MHKSGGKVGLIGRVWKKTREHASNAVVGGGILVLTGFTPEHWVATILDRLRLSDVRSYWPAFIDGRLFVLTLGVAVIVGDLLWRKHRPMPAAVIATAEVPRDDAPAAAPAEVPPVPDRPSIAVLPFQNISGDPEQEYFAEGIAEDIITELSRYPDLFVIARNSSFTYRGKAGPVTDVARELGARYVLEGSVRRDGNRVRINAQLIDAASGTHLWAQRYDRSLADLFAVQDEVTQNIVAVLPARMQAAALEYASRKTTSSLDAYDYLLRGKYCHHLETPDANREAEANFDRAIELDPRFASAYAWKACTIGQALGREFQPRTPELLQQSIQLVERAMSIDENDTECHRIMCRIALMQGQFAKSEHHLECAGAQSK